MLKIDSISKNYGDVKAVDGVSFEVAEGELFGLIGPDGAGKTTLFRIITTLLLPDEGRVHFDGRDVVDDYAYVRQNVGYMPGRFSLYQDLSVRENLEFFATIFNTTVEENKHLIEDIFKQLEPFQSRKAGALSGGMKQKLALSCALIHKPKMLLLDEPTTGVDAVSRKEFWNMLQQIKESGIAILVSTPYMDESRLCDRVALMQNGRIMDINTPAGIVRDFRRQVIEVSGDQLYQYLGELRSMQAVNAAYPFGDSLHLYTDEGDAVMGELEKTYSGKLRQKIVEAGIEDVFMNLMTEEIE